MRKPVSTKIASVSQNGKFETGETAQLEFPLRYTSDDNHPDDGKVAQYVLERILKRKIKVEETFKGGCYVWTFSLQAEETVYQKYLRKHCVICAEDYHKLSLEAINIEKCIVYAFDKGKVVEELGHRATFKAANILGLKQACDYVIFDKTGQIWIYLDDTDGQLHEYKL